MTPLRGNDPASYEQLRRHVQRPRLEHPAPRQAAATPPPVPTTQQAPRPARVSVADWLLAIGHAVVRRVRGAPRSPLVPLHPRK